MDRVLRIATGMLLVSTPVAHAGNAEHGKELFSQKCSVCHTADKDAGNRIGPNLFGVVGRPSGSLATFNYSSAMKNAGVAWTPDKLTAYLSGPQKMIPGIRMTFPGFGSAADAQDVVTYLSTLRGGGGTTSHSAAE